MITINAKYYTINQLKDKLKENDKDFYFRYRKDICNAYERIKFILFGAPCGGRPIDEGDVKMKASYSKNKILSTFIDLEEDDIDFILNEYERLLLEFKNQYK